MRKGKKAYKKKLALALDQKHSQHCKTPKLVMYYDKFKNFPVGNLWNDWKDFAKILLFHKNRSSVFMCMSEIVDIKLFLLFNKEN